MFGFKKDRKWDEFPRLIPFLYLNAILSLMINNAYLAIWKNIEYMWRLIWQLKMKMPYWY
jgi:hypothetical protein